MLSEIIIEILMTLSGKNQRETKPEQRTVICLRFSIDIRAIYYFYELKKNLRWR